MHSTLKQATLKPPARNPRQQQQIFDGFRQEYNQQRPHEAFDYATPAIRYSRSDRPMPRRAPELEYGDDVVVAAYRSRAA